MSALNEQTSGMTRPRVDITLIEQVQAKYPETAGLDMAGVVGWALRKLLQKEA